MVTVYIWEFRGTQTAWGHASMKVGHQYISWWPMGSGRVRSKIYRNIYSAHPIANRRFEDDLEAEGNRYPDHRIAIDGLDERKIMAWWRRTSLSWGGGSALGPPSVDWSSLGWNCARIVATALKEGGGDAFASWYSQQAIGFWTPNDVRDYAQSIERNL